MKDVPLLKKAIKATHGCESLHIESVSIKEVFKGRTAWEGTVEVFALINHPKAKKAFAWSYPDGDQSKTVAVLAIPPVDSPQSAVKVAIASKGRKQMLRTLLRSIAWLIAFIGINYGFCLVLLFLMHKWGTWELLQPAL